MNQELKNYFSQFIMAQINEMCSTLYSNIKYDYRKRFFSENYISSYNPICEPIYKNIRFCKSIVNEDNYYNYSKFVSLLDNAPTIHLKNNIEKAKIYLKENMEGSFLLKFEEDIDNSFFENLLDNYLPFALFFSNTALNIPKDFLEKAFLYCSENDLFKNPKGIKDIFYECESIYFGDFSREDLNYIIESSLSSELINLRKNSNFENIVYHIINSRYFELGIHQYRSYFRLADNEEFLGSFYNSLNIEEKEIMVFNSDYIDLVQKNICQDSDVIQGAKKYLDMDRFNKHDALFSAKYYPDTFKEKINTMMIEKQRDKIFNMELFNIAVSFSGITKKMARYIRSETSEKRAFSFFEQIKEKIFSQPNISEILTQFADTKHDRLLGAIIKDCPKQYLYLFISNKLVRNPHTYSHRSYNERNREQE